jgi:Ca-activated chloride channel family protein
MFSFTHPWFLLLALLVPPLSWWWLRQGRRTLRYSDTGILAGLPSGRATVARWGGAGLRAASLLFLIVALAGPRWPDPGTRIPTEGIAITMLVDVSGSMAERDFTWEKQRISRLEAVKKAFGLFVKGGKGPGGIRLEGRPDDQIGLVTFATRPESACPLTLSHDALLKLLDDEQPRTLATENQTNIGDAIAWGLHRLKKAGARRSVLVLLTDGEHNVPPPALKPRQAAQLAGNLHIPIYVIDAGGETTGEGEAEGEGGSAADRVNARKGLQEVARISGGRYFQAHDAESLLEVCQTIDRLERQEIQSFLYRRYFEGYPWCGLASEAALMLVLLLEMTFWRRTP